MQALIEGNLDEYDKKNKKRSKEMEKRLRGIDYEGAGADVIINGNDHRKKKPETVWERDLRQGRYAQALDVIMDQKLDPITVLTLLTELQHRDGAMKAAFAGRDETTVQPIFKWVTKYISDPRYVNICVHSALVLLDIYSEHVVDSPELERGIRILHRRVRTEVERAQQACQTKGMLEMLMTGIA